MKKFDGDKLCFMAFWAINDELNVYKLKQQMDEFHTSGLNGVVFHPRYYPNMPDYMGQEYLDIVSEVILYAKERGLDFWIYDENGYPSGTAGGKTLERMPDVTCDWVTWKEQQDGSFEIEFESKKEISSFNVKVTEAFIDITHEGYRRGLKPEAFDYVKGFFTDEVGFLDSHSISISKGAVPWYSEFPEHYERKYGDNLMKQLPLLFGEDEGSELIKTRYWELMTDALIDGFYTPIAKWCEKHGKLFTGHLKGEENPFFQLSYSGSCFHVLKELTIPAIDALERFPGNDFYPRIVHSVARQQGREGCLVEAHGGSGWGVTPESFTNYVVWLAGHGIDQYVFHLSQYRLKSQGVHDWPPSMPLHLTWKDAFSSVLADIRSRVSGLADIINNDPDLLIVTPTRGVMESFVPMDAMVINEHNGDFVPNTKSGSISNRFIELVQKVHDAGLHYELSEERTIEEIGRIEQGILHIGKRAYHKVLLPDGCRWSGNTVNELEQAGIVILTETTWHELANKGDVKEELSSGSVTVNISQSPWQSADPAYNLLPLEYNEDRNGILHSSIHIAPDAALSALELIALDLPQCITVGGQELIGIELENGSYIFALPEEIVMAAGEVVITIKSYPDAEPNPIIQLRGQFAVHSLTPYEEKDDRQQRTKGPFVLQRLEHLNPADLIISGLPFCSQPVQLTKEISLTQDLNETTLMLLNVHADAAFVVLDGTEKGWIWGPDWELELQEPLKSGNHILQITLYPNTYNVFGPHRHVDGDRHLVSPMQYTGQKNFADFQDAPAYTHGEYVHAVKWSIGENIQVKSQAYKECDEI